MNKIQIFVGKTLKIIFWVILIFVFSFLVVAGLIQIPALQTKIVQGVTAFISTKTHTKAEIQKLGISFPKSVVVEGLYLEDLNKDTLIFARETKINIALTDLFFKKITINSVALDGLTLNLKTTETDSLFNYHFLLEAFNDSASHSTSDTVKTDPWVIYVDKIYLNDIHIDYDDQYSGLSATVNLGSLQLEIEKMDIDKSVFKMDDLLIENLNAHLQLKKSAKPNTEDSQNPLPFISANTIQINNSVLRYSDLVRQQSAFAEITRFKLKDLSVDLETDKVNAGQLNLTESLIRYKTSTTGSIEKTTDDSPENSWKVKIKSVVLKDNALAYDVANTPVIQNSFDANHVFFASFTLKADDIYYDADKTEATILKFFAIDKNNLLITGFSTIFSMDKTSIRAENLKASTKGSSLNGDFYFQYKSLEAVKESISSMKVIADVKQASINNADILYFSPELGKQDFFQNKDNLTTFSGLITGSIGNMVGRKVKVTTGSETTLTSDFTIVGLPDAETAHYHFPNLRLVTGKKDMEMMAGTSIPQNIALPESIDLQVVFKGKLKEFSSILKLTSSFGSGHLVAKIDKEENFDADLNILMFDLGRVMRDKDLYGPVSMVAKVNGKGLDPKTIRATINATVSQLYLNKYTYRNLTVDGNISGREFAGKLNLNDENAMLNFDGRVNLNPNQEFYNFKLDVKGLDLQKLHLSNNDLRISFAASTHLKGGSITNLNGKVAIGNMMIAHGNKKYLLDSLLVATINQPKRSEINVSSALIGIKYSGTLSPVLLPAELTRFVSTYFPITDEKSYNLSTDTTNCKFEIRLHNHPILSEVFFPELTEFEPGIITGSFNREKKKLQLMGTVEKMVYGSIEVDKMALEVNSDSSALNYKLSSSEIANSQMKLINFLFDGKLANNTMASTVSSIDESGFKKLFISSVITKFNSNYRLVLNPEEFYLMNNPWNIANDNFVEFGKQGFRIHNLFLNHGAKQVRISSVNNRFKDDISIDIANFNLEDVSQIVEKDSSLVKGIVNGTVLLKQANNSYGIIADAAISNLTFSNVALGDLSVKANNPTTEKFTIDMKLTGDKNNLTANGYFVPNGGDKSLNIKADIQSLSMKTIKAFSMGQLSDASGGLKGSFLIGGSTTLPEITGKLVFVDAFITPTFLNNSLELKNETVDIKPDGIYFNSFTMLDRNQHSAVINGKILMKQFSDFVFGLNVKSKDFMLFNTTSTPANNEFYGRMIVDSDVNITGPMSLPMVNARIKMKRGSYFTVAVPEDDLTTDKGENVIEFIDSIQYNSILYRKVTSTQAKPGFVGFDLSSIIEVDKEATLKLLMDPTSTDSLVVRGEAALSFAMDKSGKMSLTGAYNLNDGSYLVSLESIIKKKFEIVPNSTIIWNGDPLDANISINASYSVRATPIDLVANQMAGATDADKAGYKQPYPFLVLLKLRGAILQPEISFEIQLAPEDKGILGGAVNQKLLLLNDDPSALNKQVFALLVLGRFVQENPLQSESSGSAESLVRSTVSNFLSAQLNRLSSRVLPGVEMNFDIQSYNDYQSGQEQGRTQVEIGMKKQLFDERLSVEVGGKVDVEGAAAKQNSVSDIAGDVTVEYKLAKDGSFRIKAFRHNQYEGAIEGQLVETGVGLVYVKEFSGWKSKKKKKAEIIKE
jgi:hypothetical protein